MHDKPPCPLAATLPAPALPARSAAAAYWPVLDSPDKVGEYTKLIPPATARAIVAELTSTAPPARPGEAARLSALLIGSYPNAQPPEPEIYASQVEAVFRMFPADLGAQAVDVLTLKLKFPPSRAEVYEAVASLAAKRMAGARTAQAHIAEHARRAREEADRRARKRYCDMTPAEQVAFDAMIGAVVRADRTAEPSRRGDAEDLKPMGTIFHREGAA